ncbi:hypothetical protein [Lacipirellula sp.]|uniref:hypothetical protein n=1 Tax=Lacipirellula sp. TaxID=2691419 RepID=UPI003D11A188
MVTPIGRVCVLAKPTRNNRNYREWQPAKIVLFVQADSYDEAIEMARLALKKTHWEIAKVEGCDRIIEERIRQQGGEPWKHFLEARRNGVSMKVFPRHFGSGPDALPLLLPPRVTEQFIDRVVEDVGGTRLDTDNLNRIADYQIGEWIFELKDLQEEGLEKPERQAKLAKLFTPYRTADSGIAIDPSILSDIDRQQFFDIISGPIQGQVKSASKQIRSTKSLINNDSARGGLIFLNTGYESFPEEEFGPLVERFVRKDTTQIEAIFCVSTWNVTNGFDSHVFAHMHPETSEHKVVNDLADAFRARFEEAMTQLIRQELPPKTEYANPQKPVVFNLEGIDFSWMPPQVPDNHSR